MSDHPEKRDATPFDAARRRRDATALAEQLLDAVRAEHDKETRDRVGDAAAAAAAAQRLLDRTHLGSAVIHTEQGPAVLWHDVERMMPDPETHTLRSL